ncbi:iron-dependent peroxidase [Clostridium sp. DJ247]|uniref:iron-dependent peroxidase n=1 Tax=Clostridium sp. DJ247 TaxID=2726188 RepID=UPI001629D64B|nr:iron-dependent peroxidase [Clostridium sp. DJ247]MBC2580540.1 iron-dependent peroxidase [Clostridium sp. DJ247]
MNYIWDLIIKAQQCGIPKEKLKFFPAKVSSPYMELSNKYINSHIVEENIEINANYRFYEIFKDLFDVNNNEYLELRETLFDIMMHFLADIDLTQGMNKKEYYMNFILEDIKNNVFGSAIQENIKLFSFKEKNILIYNLLRLYTTGETLYLLKDTIRKLFRNSIIYTNCEETEELLFYMGEEETEEKLAKLAFIKELFLPIKYNTEIYWKNHFGVIGVEQTMKIDNIAIY